MRQRKLQGARLAAFIEDWKNDVPSRVMRKRYRLSYAGMGYYRRLHRLPARRCGPRPSAQRRRVELLLDGCVTQPPLRELRRYARLSERTLRRILSTRQSGWRRCDVCQGRVQNALRHPRCDTG